MNEEAEQPLAEVIPLRRVPQQKPGRSEQCVSTPDDFMRAVQKKFDIALFDYDLAADATNAKSTFYFDEKQDSLKQDWRKLKGELWLNPPYGNIEPWARKCAETAAPGVKPRARSRIFLLVPASVGSNWWAEHVHHKARVFLLNGRITFVGHTQAYPKDLCLCLFGAIPEYVVWRWKDELKR